jgi:hypothetical protein
MKSWLGIKQNVKKMKIPLIVGEIYHEDGLTPAEYPILKIMQKDSHLTPAGSYKTNPMFDPNSV